jgi:hypothetical protein
MAKARIRRRRLPRLDRAIIDDDQALTESLEELLHGDALLQRHNRDILRYSHGLRRQMSDRAWRAFVELEERQVARFSDALDLAVKWAFRAGLRSGRLQRR